MTTAANVASGPPRLDLTTEAILDPTVLAGGQPYDPARPVRQIFLSGATGFLGAYLLHRLLQATTATIYCLVRAADAPAALARLQTKLAANQLWEEQFRERIIPIVGDLALPDFGLSAAQFADLATTVDAIYHNGAVVNFILPYHALRAANVEGTKSVMRLASQARYKALHYVSTVFVFGPRRGEATVRTIDETEPLSADDELVIGYFQSKWVAEQLLAQAREQGLPVTIYRPGVIMGDSRSGRWDNHDDFLCRLIKGCIQFGCWPAVEAAIPVAPVDLVAQAIVQLAPQQAAPPVYHLITAQGLALAALGQWVQEFGYPLTELPLRVWQQELRTAARSTQDNALALLLPLLVKRLSAASPLTLPELFLAEHAPRFVNGQTRTALGATGLALQAITAAQVTRYLADFVQQQFLPNPHPLIAGADEERKTP